MPSFAVNGLEPGSTYLLTLYASNAKGRSEIVLLRATTLSQPERRTGECKTFYSWISNFIFIFYYPSFCSDGTLTIEYQLKTVYDVIIVTWFLTAIDTSAIIGNDLTVRFLFLLTIMIISYFYNQI